MVVLVLLLQVLWAELPTWLGMVFVVAFSSCLDIVVSNNNYHHHHHRDGQEGRGLVDGWLAGWLALGGVQAIEIDGGRALNKNHELSTVGLSNFLAGLLGGFTGSYIFSQVGTTLSARQDRQTDGGLGYR